MSAMAQAPVWTALLVGMLAGCATYRPAALAERAHLAASVTVAASAIEQNGPGQRVIDPAAPLDEATVVALAVLNNPDLKAQRLKAGVADAQIFAAGLLPDPQVSIGLSRSSEHGGYDLGLAQEIQSILTRGARRAAVRAQARQVNLEILWQESQVAEKARELFITLSAGPKLRELLTANHDVLAKRYERDRTAMLQNAATVTTVAGDAAAVDDVDAQRRELELQINDAEHALHALIGLQPGAPLRLDALAVARTATREEFDRMLGALPKRRADLLALQAGYQSQEAAVRSAVLAQFPAVSLGIDRARSAEEGVATVGLSVGVSLPLFNRSRGRIAVERATREQLRAEYQARLDQAVSEADRLWQTVRLLEAQVRRLDAAVHDLEPSAEAAEREFRAGNLTLDAYANLLPNAHAKEIAAVRIRITLAQAEAALALITGTDAIRR